MKILFLLPILLLTGCSYGVYAPTNQNVPLFRQRGEVWLEASTSYAQGAAAVGKHVGLLANVQYGYGTVFLTPPAGRTKHRRLEVAAGYFSALPANPNWIYEFYAGVGIGRLRWSFSDQYLRRDQTGTVIDDPIFGNPEGVFTVANRNVFLQPTIGFRKRQVSFALSAKLNYIGYGPAGHSSLFPALTLTANTNLLTAFRRVEASPLFSAEPALTLRAGDKRVQLTLQAFTALLAPGRRNEWQARGELSRRDYFLRCGLAWKLK